MNISKIHKDFRLNGRSFASEKELLIYAKTVSGGIHSFLSVWFDPDTFIKVKTSGSTGIPKMIALKKEYMINSARATGNFFGLQAGTSALLCLSTDYIAGKMMLVRALTLGWHLDLGAPVSNPLAGRDKTYDFCAMVPMQVSHSLNEIHKVRVLIVGGGAVSVDLLERIQQVPTVVFATYGMTETITHIALQRLSQGSGNHAKSGQFRAAALGLPTDGNYHTLQGIKVSKDGRGCLVIKAPNVTDEIVITNDLVELISETEFKWRGRYDHVINSGGIKLFPEQIEQKLTALIKDRYFVAGIPDAQLGEKLVLLIEREVTSIAEEQAVILNEVKNLKILTKYEIPKAIYFVPKFIETETKKIQRKKTLDLINRFL